MLCASEATGDKRRDFAAPHHQDRRSLYEGKTMRRYSTPRRTAGCGRRYHEHFPDRQPERLPKRLCKCGDKSRCEWGFEH